jgi:hypothetical protein
MRQYPGFSRRNREFLRFSLDNSVWLEKWTAMGYGEDQVVRTDATTARCELDCIRRAAEVDRVRDAGEISEAGLKCPRSHCPGCGFAVEIAGDSGMAMPGFTARHASSHSLLRRVHEL